MDVMGLSSTFVNITSFQLFDIEDPRLVRVSKGVRNEKAQASNKRVDLTVSFGSEIRSLITVYATALTYGCLSRQILALCTMQYTYSGKP